MPEAQLRFPNADEDERGRNDNTPETSADKLDPNTAIEKCRRNAQIAGKRRRSINTGETPPIKAYNDDHKPPSGPGIEKNAHRLPW